MRKSKEGKENEKGKRGGVVNSATVYTFNREKLFVHRSKREKKETGGEEEVEEVEEEDKWVRPST